MLAQLCKVSMYHGMKGGWGWGCENKLVPVLNFLSCKEQNSVSLFEAAGQMAKLRNSFPCNHFIQN